VLGISTTRNANHSYRVCVGQGVWGVWGAGSIHRSGPSSTPGSRLRRGRCPAQTRSATAGDRGYMSIIAYHPAYENWQPTTTQAGRPAYLSRGRGVPGLLGKLGVDAHADVRVIRLPANQPRRRKHGPWEVARHRHIFALDKDTTMKYEQQTINIPNGRYVGPFCCLILSTIQ
jgi:hypothetical protein